MIVEYLASFSFKVAVRPNIAFFGSSKMILNILSNSAVVSIRRWISSSKIILALLIKSKLFMTF